MVAQIHRRNDIVKLSSRHASRRQLLAKAAMAASRVGYSRASACPGGGGGGFGGLGGGGFGGLGVSMSATHPSMAARAAGERPNHPTPSGRRIANSLWQRMLPIARRSSPFNGPTVFAHACRELT